MKRRTLPKSITIALLCLIFAALIGFSIYQNHVLENQSVPTLPETSIDKTVAADTQTAPASIPQDISAKYEVAAVPANDSHRMPDIEALEEELENTEGELDSLRRQLDEEMSQKEALKEKELEFQRTYFSDPSLKQTIRSSLERQYKDLFEELNLSDDQKEMALDAMATKAFDQTQLYTDISTALTDEDKDAIREHNSDILETCETELQDILGSDYDEYHDYVEMALTRSYVGMFSSTLEEDNQLTESQEEELAKIMYTEQMKAFNDMGYDPRYDIEFPSDVTSGNIDGQAATMAKIHSGTLENCKGVLSDAQYELYEEYLNGQQEMTEQSEMITQLSE
jgi:hypothetical protein